MSRMLSTLPILASQIAASLRTSGRTELAQQIDEAVISSVTFDDSVGAAYICVAPARPLNVVEANIIGARHGETITVDTEFDVVIDTDNFGRLVGIEILAPGALTPELKRCASG